MTAFERKRIYAVNGIPSSGKHKFAERIKYFFQDAKVVEFSGDDKKEFEKALEKCSTKRSKKITDGFLSKSFEKYNQKMECFLKKENVHIIIAINNPSFLFSLYTGLRSSVLSNKDMIDKVQDYEKIIAPHRVINYIIKCDPKEALENWIKKNGARGSFFNVHDFLEMFNNVLLWIYVDAIKPISIQPNECADWLPY